MSFYLIMEHDIHMIELRDKIPISFPRLEEVLWSASEEFKLGEVTIFSHVYCVVHLHKNSYV